MRADNQSDSSATMLDRSTITFPMTGRVGSAAERPASGYAVLLHGFRVVILGFNALNPKVGPLLGN